MLQLDSSLIGCIHTANINTFNKLRSIFKQSSPWNNQIISAVQSDTELRSSPAKTRFFRLFSVEPPSVHRSCSAAAEKMQSDLTAGERLPKGRRHWDVQRLRKKRWGAPTQLKSQHQSSKARSLFGLWRRFVLIQADKTVILMNKLKKTSEEKRKAAVSGSLWSPWLPHTHGKNNNKKKNTFILGLERKFRYCERRWEFGGEGLR